MSAPIGEDEAAEQLAARAADRTHGGGAAVVAMAGAVSVGKSTFARMLADALVAVGLRAEAVSTDGFLLPGPELSARGIMHRKGFPESYDVERLRAFLAAARAGAAGLPVPEYSHETYDVVPGATRVLPRLDVLVLEGVNALSSTVGLVDLGVYVDAADDVVETWYVERFRAYCVDPAPETFYASFAGMEADEIEAVAREVWRAVNVPNLREHIGPSRRYADVVVEKLADHRVATIVDVARR